MRRTLSVLRASVALALVALVAACSSADSAKIAAWGNPHAVYAYSGPALIGRWIATGKIENEQGSDGYYFKDRQTGRLQSVSGTTIMDPVSDAEADALVRAWGRAYGRLETAQPIPPVGVDSTSTAAPSSGRR